jgi:hypothetical protein
MHEIKINVDEKNLETLLTILNNLKPGLLSSLEVNGNTHKQRTPQYKPKYNKVIKEEDSGTRDTSGKYVSAAAFKQRLKSKKNG